jgi:hypothetical protein
LGNNAKPSHLLFDYEILEQWVDQKSSETLSNDSSEFGYNTNDDELLDSKVESDKLKLVLQEKQEHAT